MARKGKLGWSQVERADVHCPASTPRAVLPVSNAPVREVVVGVVDQVFNEIVLGLGIDDGEVRLANLLRVAPAFGCDERSGQDKRPPQKRGTVSRPHQANACRAAKAPPFSLLPAWAAALR